MNLTRKQRLCIYEKMLEKIEIVYENGLCAAATKAFRELYQIKLTPLFLLPNLIELNILKPKLSVDTLYWFNFTSEGNAKRLEIILKCIEMAKSHPDCSETCSSKFECLDACLKLKSAKTRTHINCLRIGCQETESFKGTQHEGVNVCEDGCVYFNQINL